ncbi:hypothetical protein EQP59_07425 [Ornithobacterium rhinotracheale]|uniref:Phosphatidylserine synthase n=1 Tax=Ornithobacterium rhinotracheale TaxID=28251 RepID=A0A3R5UW62_ORNRH|nr:CDP-alcohol phosphatidyltransferase family protein [Ornithobacterium rhinotracheale]QAR31176.1 hypothetical protein EQP59_07425 [Ornithobacterium rhinotracheale]
MQITKHIPNALTLSNLFSGCLAIFILDTSVFPLEYAFLCIIYSLIADFFDGLTARWFHAQSPIGLQLDSLADMVSFGVFPGFLLFYTAESNHIFPYENFIIFSIILASAYRLAKFNIDTEQSYYFKGLATPANTILCIGMYYLAMEFPWFQQSWVLVIFSLISSYLLVSNLPLFSLKFKGVNAKKLTPHIALAVIAILLFIIMSNAALAPIILVYILLSIIFKNYFVS